MDELGPRSSRVLHTSARTPAHSPFTCWRCKWSVEMSLDATLGLLVSIRMKESRLAGRSDGMASHKQIRKPRINDTVDEIHTHAHTLAALKIGHKFMAMEIRSATHSHRVTNGALVPRAPCECAKRHAAFRCTSRWCDEHWKSLESLKSITNVYTLTSI